MRRRTTTGSREHNFTSQPCICEKAGKFTIFSRKKFSSLRKNWQASAYDVKRKLCDAPLLVRLRRAIGRFETKPEDRHLYPLVGDPAGRHRHMAEQAVAENSHHTETNRSKKANDVVIPGLGDNRRRRGQQVPAAMIVP